MTGIDCTTSSNTQQNENFFFDNFLESHPKRYSLFEKLCNTKSMSKHEIKIRIEQLYAKHLNCMDADELLNITREIFYLKIALILIKKHRKNNLNNFFADRMQDDRRFKLNMGDVYPSGVEIYSESMEDHVLLIQDFIAQLSPYFTKAEQMLFKVALCDQNFGSSTFIAADRKNMR